MLLCEAAAFYKSQGLTLWDQMLKIFNKYGYYAEDLQSVTLKGIDGASKISSMMQQIRENTPKEIGGFNVIAVRDYSLSERKNVISGEVLKINLPKSNVLYFELENNGWCCVRPSGTEPKIKFYFGAKGCSIENARLLLDKIKYDMLSLVE